MLLCALLPAKVDVTLSGLLRVYRAKHRALPCVAISRPYRAGKVQNLIMCKKAPQQKAPGYPALKGRHPTAMGIAHRLKIHQPKALKGWHINRRTQLCFIFCWFTQP
jgi:hypothetical protein